VRHENGRGCDATRRKLILGALALPLAALLARRASAGETAGLAARVEAIAAPLVGRLGFSAQRLDGGTVIALNADERFPMASLFKIPIVLAALRRVHTGPGRIKGLLPRGTPVAHKTGTIGGVANDAGFVTLPDGGRMALAVFTKSSSTPVADRDRAIAETARALYDHFAT